MDRPEEFRYDLGHGTVAEVYAESWEVDILAEGGGLIRRVRVLGPRLPEKSTPERPQWVVFGYSQHVQGQAVCWPDESRLPGTRYPRKDYVYYDEVLNYRLTINRQNELEIRHANDGSLHRVRIQEQDGVVRLDTPSTRIVLKEADKTVTIECDEKLTINCRDAEIHATRDANVQVDGNAALTVAGAATVTATGNLGLLSAAAVNVTAPAVNIN